jgi:hypothetical protein
MRAGKRARLGNEMDPGKGEKGRKGEKDTKNRGNELYDLLQTKDLAVFWS